jgi:hypothetical protein
VKVQEIERYAWLGKFKGRWLRLPRSRRVGNAAAEALFIAIPSRAPSGFVSQQQRLLCL